MSAVRYDKFVDSYDSEGEKILSPEDQPLSSPEHGDKFSFLLKDKRKFDRKSNPTTPDSTLRLNSFFSGDFKLTPSSSSNYSLVSTMSSDSSSTNNTDRSTPITNKPFLTPNITRRSKIDQPKSSTLGREKTYSRSKSSQIRKKSSFGGFFKSRSKKKDFDELELPKPLRKFSTLPSSATDEFEQTCFFIPIHICIDNNGSPKRHRPAKLTLTFDLTVDKALSELLSMEGIPKDEHELFGLYEIPNCDPISSETRFRSRSLAWADNQVKRLDGGEKLVALHTLSKTSPAVERRFELRRNSNKSHHEFNRRYKTVNFGEDYYNDVGTDPSPAESECILDPPSTFSSLTSPTEPTETETTEIEKPKEMEFASESSLANKEAREEEINNLLDIYPTPSQHPFLLALRSYPILTSLLIHLSDSVMYIGSEYQEERVGDSSTFVSIKGSDIRTIHCRISFSAPVPTESPYSAMAIEPIADAKVLINSNPILFSTKVNPGDLIQLGDNFLFMYRDPLFEHHHPSYRLNWTAQLNRSVPQTDITQVHSTTMPDEASIEKCHLDSLSDINLHNLHSISVNSDDGFHSVGSLSPNEKKSMLFNLANSDTLIKAVTKNFDMVSEKGKLIPACILSQGFEHSHKSDASCAVDFFKQASASLSSSIKMAISKLNYLKIDHIFPSQSMGIYESISNEFESTLQWLNNGLEFIKYPGAYFDSVDDTADLPDVIAQGVPKLESLIAGGFNSAIEFFEKILRPSLAGLLDENHVLLSLSPTSTCTETSGYISSNTPTHSRGPPSPRRHAPTNPNTDIVIELLQLFHKTLHDTYTSSELIPEMFTRLFARIKKFLSNFIFEHGEELGLYSQAKGRQMSHSIDQIEQWANRTGLKEEYETPSTCLKSVLSLLSTPGEELVKMDWNRLRKQYPSLTPPQLHHILLHYVLPGIPGLPALPGATLAESMPHIPLVITPEHWRPSITEANSAFNQASVKERGYLPHPFTFPDKPYILLPKQMPTDIPFERYVDRLLAGLKEKSPSSPDSYDSSSNTVSPLPELDLVTAPDEFVTHRRFKSFDDIIGSTDRDSSFSSLLGVKKHQEFHRSSADNTFYDHTYDETLSSDLDGSLESLLRGCALLDRPKSLECLHSHEKSDSFNSDSECGTQITSASQYQVSSLLDRSRKPSSTLEDHPLKASHSPQNILKSKNLESDLLDLLGTPEQSSDSEDGDLTPNTIRRQICRTTLSFDIKPYSPSLPRSFISTDDTKLDHSPISRGASSYTSGYKDIRLAKDPLLGFGLELVGGDKTQERIPGIYIRSIEPESPASKCRELTAGCKIMSINGVSLFSTELSKAKEIFQNSDEEIIFRVLPCNRNF